MIRGEVVGGPQLKAYLRDAERSITTNMTRSIGRLVLMLQRNVKMDKLSGTVLRVRTGRLRRSINSRMQGEGTQTVAGFVGTNVSYARAHEYGFTGQVNVKQHLRMQVKAFGRSIEPTQVVVSAHPRNVVIPERSFLRSALSDMQPTVRAELRNAVTEAVR